MKDSSFGRIIGVLTAPQKTFEKIAARPDWLIPMAVLIGAGILLAVLMTQRIDFEQVTREAIAQRGSTASEEQIQSAIEFQEKFGSVLGVVNPIVFGSGILLLSALFFWVGFKMFGSDLSYKTALSTTLYGFMPSLLSTLLSIPVVLSRGSLGLTDLQSGGSLLASNLGVLAGEETAPTVRALLSSVDLFSIWMIVLLTIGFSLSARTSRKSAAVTVLAIWILGVLVKVGWVAITT